MKIRIVGVSLDVLSNEQVRARILEHAGARESSYVCVCNVHMVMEAHDSASFSEVVGAADLVVPDGMPLVWLMRQRGARAQQRVRGPDLMLALCLDAQEAGIGVGLYGASQQVLDRLCENLQRRFPRLNVAYRFSPPFRAVTEEEDRSIVDEINESGTQILFVGLGCPRQEKWMHAHKGRVNAIMVGVGAAFDIHAGARSECPRWMQSAGLEWAFRLGAEPRRLWRRYLKHNPRFLVLAAWESIKGMASG